MTAEQYKKILSIAEALLRKVDMPIHTIKKYEALKQKILSDPTFEANTTKLEEAKVLNIELKIKEKIIETFENFLSTSTKILQGLFGVEDMGIASISAEKSLSFFYENFNEKKIEIRDLVVESDISGRMRLALKAYIDDTDKISRGLDDFFEGLAGVQKIFFENFEKDEKLKNRISNLEKELDEYNERFNRQEEMLSLYNELKEENSEVKNEIIEQENEMRDLKENFENLENEKKILEENFEILSEKTEIAVENFKPYCEEYQDFYEGELDTQNIDDVFKFIELLVKKMEVDTKELIAKNENLEIELEKNLKDMEEKKKVDERNFGLIGLVGDIVKGNEEKFREFENLEEKFKRIVQGPIGVRALKINR